MAKTYEPIATTTLGSSGTTVTFSSIPGTYTDLRIIGDASYATGGVDNADMRFNSDSGSNYSWTTIIGDGTSATSSRFSGYTSAYFWQLPTTAGGRAMITVDILSYANTNVFKTFLSSSAAGGYRVSRWVGLWRSTSAITSVSIIGQASFSSGSTFSLYGIKAA